MVAISGQCGYHPDRTLAEGLEAQIHLAFENLGQALDSYGANLDDVLSVDVYIASEEQFKPMNDVYSQYFTEPRPARTTVTAGLRPGVLFEISALAVLDAEPH
jgi:2-iminobutanoate/2-iminopropanoate deaminase